MRKIGKIKEAHGLKGEVQIILYSKDYSWANQIKQIFLSSEIFLNVLSLSKHRDGLKVKLESITTRNQSEALIGQDIYLPNTFFKSNKNESLYLSEIQGFSVQDKNLGLIGKITDFSSNGAQDILVVSNFKSPDLIHEILFVNDFVLDINFDEKLILMDLPEGLVELNCS